MEGGSGRQNRRLPPSGAEFADEYVPLDGILAAASVHEPPVHWAADGIHPTRAGAELIARYYVEAALPLLK